MGGSNWSLETDGGRQPSAANPGPHWPPCSSCHPAKYDPYSCCVTGLGNYDADELDKFSYTNIKNTVLFKLLTFGDYLFSKDNFTKLTCFIMISIQYDLQKIPIYTVQYSIVYPHLILYPSFYLNNLVPFSPTVCTFWIEVIRKGGNTVKPKEKHKKLILKLYFMSVMRNRKVQ